METAKLFTNGKSQAVRLPKKFRVKGDEVFIKKIGDAIVLFPKKNKWNILFDSLNKFSDDYLEERNQPELENREEMFS